MTLLLLTIGRYYGHSGSTHQLRLADQQGIMGVGHSKNVR